MTRARLLALVLALVLVLAGTSACQSTLWYGHSSDRRHRVEALTRGGEQRIRRDGHLEPRFEAIGLEALRFSSDGRRLAYPARRAGGWIVVLDGLSGPRFDGIGELRFSPDGRRLAYAALLDARWRVVCDGQRGPEAEALLAGSLTFSGDSRRLAYVIADGAERRVVADGRPGPRYRAIGKLAFDGDRLRYLARGSRGIQLVVEGRAGPAFDAISEVAFAPRSRRLGYLARRGKWVAVIDGEVGPPHDELAGLRFSDDGRRVAYVARRGSRAQVVLDSTPGPLFDGVRIQSLAFTRRGELLYIARDAGRYRVVHGAKPGPVYDAVELPVTGPHGERWGYIARQGKRHEVVVDGAPIGAYSFAADLVFGSTGSPHYVVARGGRRAVVHRGHEHELDLYVEGTLVVSRDGEHWACLAGERRRRELFIWIDGIWKRPFDLQELVAAVSRSSDRAELLRRWVAAELELAIPR